MFAGMYRFEFLGRASFLGPASHCLPAPLLLPAPRIHRQDLQLIAPAPPHSLPALSLQEPRDLPAADPPGPGSAYRCIFRLSRDAQAYFQARQKYGTGAEGGFRAGENMNLQILARQNLCHFLTLSEQIMYGSQ